MSHVEWDQNVCSPGLNFRKNSFHCVTCPFYSNCWKMIKIRICLRKIKNKRHICHRQSNLLSTYFIFLSCNKITHKQKKPLFVHRPRAIYISKSNECPFTVMDLYMQHVGMYPSFWNVQNCRIVFASNTRAIKTFCIKSWILFPITLIQFSSLPAYIHEMLVFIFQSYQKRH